MHHRRTHWLNQHGWHLSPTDATNGPFQATHKTYLDMFGFALNNKEKFWDDISTFFEGDRGSRSHWAEWFPAQEKLLDGSLLRPDAPVIVDVSGNAVMILLDSGSTSQTCRGGSSYRTSSRCWTAS